MADLGKVVVTDGGNYVASVTYEKLTFVHYQGDAYMTLKTVKGVTPKDDGSNYKLFCKSAELATASKAGIVLPDGTTTTVDTSGKISVKKATTSSAGIVKPAATDFTVAADGTQKINTSFTQAATLANIIANEAISSVLGKVSKAIATTMNLNQNALLKSMISNIDINDQGKVNSAAYIHTLVERIGMGNTLAIGDNLTDAANKLNTAFTQLNGDWLNLSPYLVNGWKTNGKVGAKKIGDCWMVTLAIRGGVRDAYAKVLDNMPISIFGACVNCYYSAPEVHGEAIQAIGNSIQLIQAAQSDTIFANFICST